MNIDKNYLRENLRDDMINLGFDGDSIDVGIEALVESFENSFPSLNEAIQSKNLEEIRFHAHALKGTFANFENSEFNDLASFFKEIEFAVKERKDFSEIEESFKKVNNSIKNWVQF